MASARRSRREPRSARGWHPDSARAPSAGCAAASSRRPPAEVDGGGLSRADDRRGQRRLERGVRLAAHKRPSGRWGAPAIFASSGPPRAGTRGCPASPSPGGLLHAAGACPAPPTAPSATPSRGTGWAQLLDVHRLYTRYARGVLQATDPLDLVSLKLNTNRAGCSRRTPSPQSWSALRGAARTRPGYPPRARSSRHRPPSWSVPATRAARSTASVRK